MNDIQVALLEPGQADWLENEFNSRWPWPRRRGFVAATVDSRPHFVALDSNGRYLGHCHVRESRHPPFVERQIHEIADLNVMPDSRRRGAATVLLDAVEAHVAAIDTEIGIGVGLYDAYGPAQRLYVARGYVPDGTGIWADTISVKAGDHVIADDDLVLYLTKPLR